MTTSSSKTVIETVDCRGGASTGVVAREETRGREGGNFMSKVLRNLRDDKNLIYLAARLQNYSEVTDARMVSLKAALLSANADAVTDIAHALTDSTAKLGAIRMMKLCIALQMMGRRNLLDRATELFAELETEYDRFKQNLMYAVG
jgi:HPt (histidine-containing phosphotransfer) domain-containing protein